MVIDLQSSAGIATMIDISVVDESVYALNEGRLNLKQIFDELEKIFMEPRAEAHPDEGRFWIPTGTGAADIFEDAGVQVIASEKLDIPQAYGGWGWEFVRGGGMVLDAAEAARQLVRSLKLGRFRLNKVLPVAAGLGGGSADAAAALRLISRINSDFPAYAKILSP